MSLIIGSNQLKCDLELDSFTKREQIVLSMIRYKSRKISEELNISIDAVNKHIANIYEKMNIDSDLCPRVHTALWALSKIGAAGNCFAVKKTTRSLKRNQS